jgi:hypothetical protein
MANEKLPELEANEDMLDDVSVILDNVELLDKIVVASEEIGHKVGMYSMAEAIALKLKMPSSNIKKVISTLLNLYQFKQNLEGTSTDVTKVLANSLHAAPNKEYEEIAKRWDKATPIIVAATDRLRSDHPIVMATKAYADATTHQYVLTRMELFTDIRPVFNESGESILEAIITHVLSFDYHEGNTHREIKFSLDAIDVKDLKELCAKAELKGKVIKRDLKSMAWPTTIFRESIEVQD